MAAHAKSQLCDRFGTDGALQIGRVLAKLHKERAQGAMNLLIIRGLFPEVPKQIGGPHAAFQSFKQIQLQNDLQRSALKRFTKMKIFLLKHSMKLMLGLSD